MKKWKIAIYALLLAAAGACGGPNGEPAQTEEQSAPRNLLYGIDADDYRT